MLVSVVASTSVTRAVAACGGTVPVAAWRDLLVPLPTGPIVARRRPWPVAARNATVTAALLCAVPPSQADRSYRMPDPGIAAPRSPGSVGRPGSVAEPGSAARPGSVAEPGPVAEPGTRRSETSWRSRVVPPAPPANSCPPGTAGHRPEAGGKPGVPYRTAVGKPLTTCQPGIVTLSQPCADTAPVCAPGFSSRLVPGRTAAWLARPGVPAMAPACRAAAWARAVVPACRAAAWVRAVVPACRATARVAGPAVAPVRAAPARPAALPAGAGRAQAGPEGSAASVASIAVQLTSAAAAVVTERPDSPVICRTLPFGRTPRGTRNCLIVQSTLAPR